MIPSTCESALAERRVRDWDVSGPGWRRAGLIAAITLAVAGGTTPAASAASALDAHAGHTPDFGSNVIIFDPSMPTAEIQATVDAIAAQQTSNEFGSQRYALLFRPGTYGTPADPLVIPVGYYTQVAGLGATPGDVVINGKVNVYNQCLAPDNCIALTNFWRSVSNLTIAVAGQSGCRAGTDFWAVSQASPMRRVSVVGGNVSLMDYCTAGPQYASGGFIADSAFSGGTVINGSQQQFLVRNSHLDGWTNGVWNQVFAGTIGAPAQSFPNPPYTTLDTNPISREAPFLYLDDTGQYRVFIPDAQRNSRGTTWEAGPTPGYSLPLSRFYIARPTDSAARLNAALARGMNLLFTPGVYAVDRTLDVRLPDTILLGIGLATLEATGGVPVLRTANVPGVEVAGLIVDAGPRNTPVLVQIGERHGSPAAWTHAPWSDPRNPTLLADVFFRIGGPHLGKATVSLEVNTNDVLLDDIWAWRADHGSGVGWTSNTADTGLIVNGDRVAATGLFVEHYQKDEVIWTGEHGSTIMFQNEMPYDPPNQAAWSHGGTLGYAAYAVASTVHTHQAWGLGSYCYFNVDPTIHASRTFAVPENGGVRLHDVLDLSITNHGTIDHVVNDYGPPTDANTTPNYVLEYPPGA